MRIDINNLPNRVAVDEFGATKNGVMVCVNSPRRANGIHYLKESTVKERISKKLKEIGLSDNDIYDAIKAVVKRK